MATPIALILFILTVKRMRVSATTLLTLIGYAKVLRLLSEFRITECKLHCGTPLPLHGVLDEEVAIYYKKWRSGPCLAL
jgi:hypothetical protein